MKLKKGLCVLTAAIMAFSVTSVPEKATYANEMTAGVVTATPETAIDRPYEANLTVADSYAEGKDAVALFTQKLHVPEKVNGKSGEITSYFKFTLQEDAWVSFTGNYSLSNHEGLGTSVRIFSDPAYSNLKVNFGWGFFVSDRKEASAVLPAGTYYGTARSKHGNYRDFDGNMNIVAVAVPTEKAVKDEQVLGNKKDKAILTITSGLGEKTFLLQYRQGKIGTDAVKNEKYWGKMVGSSYFTSSDKMANEIKLNDENEYKFEVKKNGYYTIHVLEKNGTAVSKIIHVTGIDDRKPQIKGVKNGKTYKGSVSVKFSDKGTGIKSAVLNGKKVQSGVKIRKAGNYLLVVRDKAGNMSKVSFKVVK